MLSPSLLLQHDLRRVPAVGVSDEPEASGVAGFLVDHHDGIDYWTVDAEVCEEVAWGRRRGGGSEKKEQKEKREEGERIRRRREGGREGGKEGGKEERREVSFG